MMMLCNFWHLKTGSYNDPKRIPKIPRASLEINGKCLILNERNSKCWDVFFSGFLMLSV